MNEDILNILFYNFLWIVLFFYLRKKTTLLTPSRTIVGMYLFFSFCSLALYLFYADCDPILVFRNQTTMPFLYLFITITILLIPIIYYDNSEVKKIQCPSNKIIIYFVNLYIICSIAMVPSIFASLQEGIVRIMLDAESGAELYQEFHENESIGGTKAAIIMRLFSFISNYCYEVFVFVFFYGLANNLFHKKKLLVVTIIIIIQLLIPISRGLRTMFLMKFIPIVFSAIIFYSFYNNSFRLFFKKITIYFLIAVSIPFVLLTVGRSLAGSGNPLESPVIYTGQAPLVFNKYCFYVNGTREGNRTCNEFKKILGFENVPEVMNMRNHYSYLRIDDGHFYTFVGDFVLDFGLWISFIIMTFLSFIVYKITKTKHDYILFHQLLILFFLMCIIAEGAMYLFTYSYKNNWIIIVVIIAAIVFKFDSTRRPYSFINEQ